MKTNKIKYIFVILFCYLVASNVKFLFYKNATYGIVTDKIDNFLNKEYALNMSVIGTGHKDGKIDRLIYNFNYTGNINRKSLEIFVLHVVKDILAIANSSKGFSKEMHSFPLTYKNLDISIALNSKKGFGFTAPTFSFIWFNRGAIVLVMYGPDHSSSINIKSDLQALLFKHREELPQKIQRYYEEQLQISHV